MMYLRRKLSYKIQKCFSEFFRKYMCIVTLCCQSAQKPDESGLTSFLCDFVAQVSQKWSVKNLLSNHRTKRIFAEDNLSLRRRFHELFVYFHAESMLRTKNLHTIFKAFFSQYFLIKYLNFIVKFIISTIPLNNIVSKVWMHFHSKSCCFLEKSSEFKLDWLISIRHSQLKTESIKQQKFEN